MSIRHFGDDGLALEEKLLTIVAIKILYWGKRQFFFFFFFSFLFWAFLQKRKRFCWLWSSRMMDPDLSSVMPSPL